jgi:hypothetical protein
MNFVIGEWNVLETTGAGGGEKGDYILIIGNGTSDIARSNAFTVTWLGDAYAQRSFEADEQGSAPTTPASGRRKLYCTTVGWYDLDDTGTSTALSGGGSSPLTTKGDLYTYSTADARLPIGTNDQVLTADSTQATGMKWADASGGGGLLIAEDSGYGLDNGSTNRGTVGTESVSLEYSNLAVTSGALGIYSFCAGYLTTTGDYASVCGGNQNSSFEYGFIGGGFSNSITTTLKAVICGGYDNSVSGGYAVIAGGRENTATQQYSFVGGGRGNDATGQYSTIIVGLNNGASGLYAVTIGGQGNSTTGDYSSVLNGISNIATGNYSTIVSGEQNQADGIYSAIGGLYAKSTLHGQEAYSAGRFSVDGDAQFCRLQMRNSTSGDTETELFLDGSSLRAVLPADSAWAFTVKILGKVDASGNTVHHRWEGTISNNAGTVAIQGTSTQTVVQEFNASCETSVTADDTNDSLKVTVTGIAATNMRWHAYIEYNQVIY